MYYILKNKQPIKVQDITQWAELMRPKDKVVKQDHIGEYYISTVFLGIEHGKDDNGEPLLFETMMFKEGDWGGEYQDRYATWDDALAGHDVACEIAKSYNE